MLYGVPSNSLDLWWPKVRHLVGRAAARSRGKETAEDVLTLLRARKAQLWAWLVDGQVEAICVTEIDPHPRGKTLGVRELAGRGMNDWLPCLRDLETWGREQGCMGVRVTGRPGLERVLKPYGYEKTNVVLELGL